MAESRNSRRAEAAAKLFTSKETGQGETIQPPGKHVNEAKMLWDALWKNLKREQSRWWEAAALTKYLECNRIPRGLRIFIIPTFQDPDPELISDWMENNHICSINMLKMLVKNAEKECAKINTENEAIIEKLKAKYTDIEFSAEMEKMHKRLDKIEDEIKEKKQRKFYRDEVDYSKGQILTFAKRYEVIRDAAKKSTTKSHATPGKKAMVPNPETTIPSDNVTLEEDTGSIESDVSEPVEQIPVKELILKEVALMTKERQTGTPTKGRGRGGRGGRGRGNRSSEAAPSTTGVVTRGKAAKI
ncbi:uncharacterized protein LOC144827773 [Lissotriton helveticus]